MYKFFAFIFLVMVSCTPQSTTETLSTSDSTSVGTHVAAPAINYPLDSLLSFKSEAELVAVYGRDYITRETRYCPEGICEYMASILFKDTDNEIEFMWNDDSVNFAGLLHVEAYARERSDWKTKSGITIGTTLKELEYMNGQPFRFYGFGWDYSGQTFFEGGKLENLNASLTLGLREGTEGTEADSLYGDSMDLRSDLPVAQRVNPIVVAITMLNNKD